MTTLKENSYDYFEHSIGLAIKSFRFFPLDDFSRAKSFFSIANFRSYHRLFSKKSFKSCCLFIVLH